VIRLALADDHPIVLDGLEQLFRLETDCEVVARCRDGEETLRALRELRPDVLILDVRMPRGDGLEVLAKIREERLPTRVVLLTAALDDEQLLLAIRRGVEAVVLKEMAPERLLETVRRVHQGERWLEPALVARALATTQRERSGGRSREQLTPREREIVRMVARGMRNRAIAEQLHIAEGTVKIHLHNIYEKLAVNGRVELAVQARELGLD
jgi:DNA-binding NarL/FixJ family response regulator